MSNRARLFTLDTNGDTVKTEDFPFIEDAMAAAEAAGGAPGEWGDTQIGYEWMTEAGRETLNDTGEYPERYWQILGLDDGEEVEVCDEHHRPE